MPNEGNSLSGCSGRGATTSERKEKKEQKNKEKLVRIGSRYFSKDTRTERRLNIGLEVGKVPSGVRFKTLNEVIVDKQHV